MERRQWSKVREPSLLLSDHPPLWQMADLFKDISVFSGEGNGVVVVMDAVYLKLAQTKYEFDGIPVDIKRSIGRVGSLSAYLRSMIVRTWGGMIGAYDGAYRGMEVVEQMRDALDLGRNVFLCPAAGGNVSGKWRWGVGSLTRGIYEDGEEKNLGLGLIFVSKNKYVLIPFSNMDDIFEREFIEEVTCDKELAIKLQEVFENLCGTL